MLGASRISLAAARERLARLAEPGAGVDLDVLSSELLAITGLLARELPLRRALTDPSTDPQAKAALIEGLLGDRVGDTSRDFLKELVADRWSRPGDLVDGLEALAVLAAFEQAMVNGQLDEVEDELFRFARVVERENALREALESGWVGVDRKRELLAGLLDGKVGPMTLRVVTAAAGDSVRRRTVGEALDHFSRLAAELRDRMNARVTLAVEPTPEQLDRLRDELSRVFGVTMGLRVEIDPDIIGGAVIRVGDQVMDASIARRIDTARRGLAPA